MNTNIKAFLDMLAWSEGTIKYGNNEGYDVLVGGSTFNSFVDHPRKLITINSKLKSTAAGRYQLLARYFDHYKKLLNLKDFGPESQDSIAIQMIKEQGAYNLIINGKLKEAIEKCSNIWASLPGAGYGQHEHSFENLRTAYLKAGGKEIA